MKPQDSRKERRKRYGKALQAAMLQLVEQGNADDVVILAAFHEKGNASALMASFGNAIACARMIEKAHMEVRKCEVRVEDEP